MSRLGILAVLAAPLALSACCHGPPDISGGIIGRPPGGGLLNSIDRSIASAAADRLDGDKALREERYSSAHLHYCFSLASAVRVFNWSQEYETFREWFGTELCPQVTTVVALIPQLERAIRRIEAEHSDVFRGRNAPALANVREIVAATKIDMEYPVTREAVEATEKRSGACWWVGHRRYDPKQLDPLLVNSWEEAWLAVEERMRRLDLYTKGKGPRPPHVHGIVKELRAQGKIGPEPKLERSTETKEQ